jgi:hypothetical protein
MMCMIAVNCITLQNRRMKERQKLQKLHLNVVNASSPVDRGNCMLGWKGRFGTSLSCQKKGSPQLQRLKPNQVCSVPEELCEPGFPLNQGEKMPRHKRARKEQMIVWECSLEMANVHARWVVVKGSRKQAAQGGLLSKIVNSHFKLHCEQWLHRRWDDAAPKIIVCVLVLSLVTKMQRACSLCVSCFSRNRVLHLNFINSFHSGCKVFHLNFTNSFCFQRRKQSRTFRLMLVFEQFEF